jgi:sodium transport system ATP-binding protein
MITADKLTKTFRKGYPFRPGWRDMITAVDHVSFACRSGEIFGLIGPNGSGKTTLMRMLATLIQPTSGTACVGGYDIDRYPDAVRQSIGFVSPSHGLFDTMSVRYNLEYFAMLNGIDRHEVREIADDVMEWLGLTKEANTICSKLSTGMKQRTSIARAIVHQPPVLLLDEPSNGLDVDSYQSVQEFIRSCRDEGQTILLSTHIMAQAEAICDRIAVIHNGRILAVGTLRELAAQTGCDRLADIQRELVRVAVREEVAAVEEGRAA